MALPRALRFAILALAVALALAAFVGSVDIAPDRVVRTALSGLGLASAEGVPQNEQVILLYIRFPRVVLLALVGGALAISGASLQAMFQNPMADPGVLGVTGGGAFGAVLAIYLGFPETVPLSLPMFAFAGALTAAFLVYSLAHLGGRPSSTALLLTGVAIGSLAAAGMSWLLIGTQDYRVKQVIFWLVGGAEGRTWSDVGLAMPFIVAGGLVLLVAHRSIDVLALGDDHAWSVGVSVGRVRLLLLCACALAAGAAVSVCGSISFVGLIVPHALRYLVGSSTRVLLPCCFLGGGAFLVACDAATRMLSRSQEIHLGILTAFLGVPFLLVLLVRSQRTAV